MISELGAYKFYLQNPNSVFTVFMGYNTFMHLNNGIYNDRFCFDSIVSEVEMCISLNLPVSFLSRIYGEKLCIIAAYGEKYAES